MNYTQGVIVRPSALDGLQGQVVDSPFIEAMHLQIAKDAAEVLHRHYPGHLWATCVQGGMLDVRNIYLSGTWGFRLRIPDIYSASDWDHQVMLAGGELLERYRQRRAALHEGSMLSLSTDFAGRHRAEL